MENKIIQIMPAPQGLHAVFSGDDGEEHYTPVVCLALTDEGDVLMMDTCDHGLIESVHDIANFKGIKWVGDTK